MLFAFISRMETGPWGGSEELWSQTAKRLRIQGHEVMASVRGWEGPTPPKLKELEDLGVAISYRRPTRPLPVSKRILRRIPGDPFHIDWLNALTFRKPDFVLISEPSNHMSKVICDALINNNIPFALILHGATGTWWPADDEINDAVYIYQHARAVFFVSDGTRQLTRKQVVSECLCTQVIRNPYNVNYDATLPWPQYSDVWKAAVVGRLEPGSKGCDILLEVLGATKWKSRNLRVSFFGDGPNARSLKKYSEGLGLANVHFRGHATNIEEIWNENQVLLLPSRIEGMPLAVVEAMLCRRPCVATDVGGNAELIQDSINGFLAEAPTVKHLDQAMERAWNLREQWREIGEKAGSTIRACIPSDPAGIFAATLIQIALSPPCQINVPSVIPSET